MPIEYNSDNSAHFRVMTRSSLVLLRQPIVRSLAKLRRLHRGQAIIPEGPLMRSAGIFPGTRLLGQLPPTVSAQ
ncbi:MAG: hypothetical protein EBT98_09575 [Opitutaceae bacterium]|nr:hypothetical protein [Opitutaceae bacterium]NBR59362.1 hypothetical protein [Opitutaceae bacterium]